MFADNQGRIKGVHGPRPGVSKLRPAGRMRPGRPLGAARGALLDLTLDAARLEKPGLTQRPAENSGLLEDGFY